MKNQLSQIAIFMLVAILLFNCSDDGDESGGCSDPESVNFDASAISDNGSCLYSADMIAGDWQASEEMSFSNPLSGASDSGTDSFILTFVKMENDKISITTNRNSERPNHDLGNFSFKYKVSWKEKTIGPLGLFSGEIVNDDNITIDYQLGLPEGLYTVELDLERI
ncbi:hypothetical protein [Reichenbachiella sp.]|uniref:hypothetical protein n=1 Tax=Reichenbachiella sp. TaxID=2184521 RepID=UPI003B5905D9